MMQEQAPEAKTSPSPALSENSGAQGVVAYARLLLQPSYHLKRIIEDLRAARHALAQWDLDCLRSDEGALAQAIRGRMFATFLLSGLFGVFGPILGTANQYVTKNPYEGFFVGLIVANLFGSIGYQIIWWVAHQKMYRARKGTGVGRFLALERDLLPLQWDGLRYTALFLLITAPIMLALIAVIHHFAAPLAQVIPFPVIMVAVETVVVHSSLVRVMGDLFEKHAARVSHDYLSDIAA
jgi:hypothetical protein